MDQLQRVVILGGGFGGLSAAQNLKRVPVEVTLVDRRNFHLFQPLLYQVATGWLSPANISSTLRAILKHQKNARVLLGEAKSVDTERRRVLLDDGDEISYDTLIVATGSRPFYFGNEHWQTIAPGLKTIEDATTIRSRIFIAFEAAEREIDPAKIPGLLTFAIVGGGPTGVELAGALGEIAHDTLKHDFRNIDPAQTQILLLEGGDRILPTYPPELSEKAEASLEKLGVTVRAKALVSDIRPEVLIIKRGDGFETIPCRTVIWAAGVQASPLGRALAKSTGSSVDRGGRIAVEPDLTIAGHPEIFVIGDLAHYVHQSGKPLPGVAPVALQQGKYVVRVIDSRIKAKPIEKFHYRDRGNMAIVGHASAVAEMGRVRFSGYFAWLAWLFVHLVNLIEFQNRILVLVQWGWYYFSRNRAARLITGDTTLKCEPADEVARDELRKHA
jgi:NADH:quinone reductase (non-electrogenic)